VATALSAPTWTSQLNDMPQIGDQVQTSTLAFADHGAKITSCNCDGCDHAYWDSDRDTPRDFSETQCFDQCVTEAKCKFALYDSEVPRIPDSYKENAVLDRTASPRTGTPAHPPGGKVIRKCWLYEHVPEDGIGKKKGNVTEDGLVHQTCYRKTTLAPTTLAPTNA